MQHQLLSDQVFGSSKRIQLIGMSPMETLLNAVDRIEKKHPPPHAMSIESLLDSNGHTSPAATAAAAAGTATIATAVDEPAKRRRLNSNAQGRSKTVKYNDWQSPPMATVTCFHASVAQKSYGAEKRFLCPPPLVRISNRSSNSATSPLVSMAVVCENGERPLEHSMTLDDQQCSSFKYLHVTGTAKAKQFHLRLSLHSQSTALPTKSPPSQAPFATFYSAPIAIISKPSKKISKTRNVSSCVVASLPVSLFNRINSQTVRTKYMTVADGKLCAKNNTWSPFDIIVVRQPTQSTDEPSTAYTSGNMPVTYGSEIILKDTESGVTTPPMMVCKVDKGFISPATGAPVSQMQKIALCLASSYGTERPVYLSAGGKLVHPAELEDNPTTIAAAWLDFAESEYVAQLNAKDKVERVADHLCWTIVSIDRFERQFSEAALQETHELPHKHTAAAAAVAAAVATTATQQRVPQPSPPPSPPRRIMPLPVITSVQYQSHAHTVEVVGQHLTDPSSSTVLFDFCLGANGPLGVSQQHVKGDVTHLSLQMPPSPDLILANHNQLITRSDGERYLELPFLLVRHDGSTIPSGKALACDLLVHSNVARWSVVTPLSP